LKIEMHALATRVIAKAFAIGLAMFGSFVLIPQLVQTPSALAGYGFAASVTGEIIHADAGFNTVVGGIAADAGPQSG